jgi:hypothetical protein
MIKMSKLLGMIVLALVFSLIGCGGGGGGSSEKPDNNKPQTGDGGAKITKLGIYSTEQIYVVLEFEETVWTNTYLDKSQFKLKIGEVDYQINEYGFTTGFPIEIGHSCIFEDENHVTQVVGTEYEVTVVYTKPAGKAGLEYDRKDSNHDNIPVPSFTVTQKIVATAN